MKYPRIIVWTLLFLSLAPVSRILGAPPTDDQVKAAVASYHKHGKPEQNDPRVAAALKGIDIAEMSVPQFELLGIMLDLAPRELRKQFRERLAHLAKQKDADGAVAAAQIPRLIELPEEGEPDTFNDDRVDALIAAGDHPGFPTAIRAGRGTTVYFFMFFYAEHERMVNSGLSRRLAALVDEKWPLAQLSDLLAFTEAMISPDAGLERKEIDRLREIATKLAQKQIAAPDTPAEVRDMLLEAVTNLNSAAARGQLVGSPAPALHFLWTNAESKPKTIADFKGKVVLLDFWATWCGPCIAAFPHMRELRERYKDAPVVILGITSLQGWILDAKAKDPAKRRLENLPPDEELKHLAEWVKRMDMTWTVAVTRENVFNPDYSVRGIPTVVIIDAKGIVRHAGLSPNDPKITEFLDTLVQEASPR